MIEPYLPWAERYHLHDAVPCPSCKRNNAYTHQLGDKRTTYCPDCGHTEEAKQEPKRKRWTPAKRKAPKSA